MSRPHGWQVLGLDRDPVPGDAVLDVVPGVAARGFAGPAASLTRLESGLHDGVRHSGGVAVEKAQGEEYR